jgi:SHS2 domain-containing protein
MKAYEIIEHTADIGVKAYGDTLSEAFAHAAQGMFDIITDTSQIKNKGTYRIELSAENLEELLVDWLGELLFLQGARNLVFGDFNVTVDEKNSKLSANVSGEELNSEKHTIGTEIKAVTYHMLEIRREKPCFVTVLFDI